jgi:predicted membrane channel-forming protein YqfA (hemolysin III family)
MYKNPEQIHWQFITLEKAQFILEKSEESLRLSAKDYEHIDNKIATTRNFLIVGIAAMLSTLSFAQEPFITGMLFLIGGFCFSLGILIYASQAEKYPSLGRNAQKLMEIDYIKTDLCNLILSYLSPHNECLEHATKLNFKKAKLYNRSLFIIIIISIISSATIAYKYFL